MRVATYLILFLTPLIFFNQLSAQQTPFRCGNPEERTRLLLAHPEILKAENDLEEFTDKYIKEHSGEKAGNTYIIPVVFHIIHNFGSENISDAQVYDAIRVLNNDFQKLNADTASTIALFRPIAANCKMEFRLARKDPNGNCTNGIDRIQSQLTYNADDNSKLDPWPNNKYLNIWVVNSLSDITAAAYTLYPSTAQFVPSLDGVIATYTYVGSIGTSSIQVEHTLSHEVGHFFNLKHPWGDTNQPGVACGDDKVTDTPITEGWTICNINGSVCKPGVIENVQNFMDYSYCSTMFTNGQRDRMYAALNAPVASRNNLWTIGNLRATGTDILSYAVCAPEPVIVPQVPLTACAGNTLTFSSLSYNGPATSWSWKFSGGNPATSTDSIPSIVFPDPGTYNLTLTTSNSTGSNTIVFNNYVNILPDSPEHHATAYFQNFENINFPNSEWNFVSSNNNIWKEVNFAGYSGTHSLEVNNSGNSIGLITYFVTPTFDITDITGPLLYFRVAFAQTQTSDNDLLRVYVSQDCGRSWVIRYSRLGAKLATVPLNAGNFIPSGTSDWRQDYCSATAFPGQTSIRFKFEYTYRGGNNIYIDDINFNQPTGIENINRDIALSVFPNPAEGKHFGVSFNLQESSKTKIYLVSMDGREMELMNSDLSTGHQLLYFSPMEAAEGVYLLKLVDKDGRIYTQRLVIQ